jgi:putative ABC transport system substrate-binding protein
MTMWYSAVGCLVTLTLGLLAAPLAVNAQPAVKVARIGCLSVAGSPGSTLAEAFRQGLRELGYVEGHNIAIEFCAAEGSDRLPAIAAELVQLPVDVIVAILDRGGLGGQKRDYDGPNRHRVLWRSRRYWPRRQPRTTRWEHHGLTGMATELGGKRLELLRAAVPRLSRVAVL